MALKYYSFQKKKKKKEKRKSTPLPCPFVLLPLRGRGGLLGARTVEQKGGRIPDPWWLWNSHTSPDSVLPFIFIWAGGKSHSWLKQCYVGFLVNAAAFEFDLGLRRFWDEGIGMNKGTETRKYVFLGKTRGLISSEGAVSRDVCRKIFGGYEKRKTHTWGKRGPNALTFLAYFILLVTLRWTVTFHFSRWEIGARVSPFFIPFCISQGHCHSMMYEMWTWEQHESRLPGKSSTYI